MKAIKNYFILFAPLYFVACLLFVVLHKIMPGGYVFGILMRMYTYHYNFPFMYILIPVVAYSAIVFFLRNKITALRKWRKIFLMLLIMFLAVIISSPFGGLLWVYHDIQAGFVPETNILIQNLCWGALEGLKLGWLIIAISIPYNILGVCIGVLLTNFILKKYIS